MWKLFEKCFVLLPLFLDCCKDKFILTSEERNRLFIEWLERMSLECSKGVLEGDAAKEQRKTDAKWFEALLGILPNL